MSKGYQKLNVKNEELENGMKEARSAQEFKRYQAVYLRTKEGMNVKKIAEVTGLAESTIHNLHSQFRSKGIKAIKARKRGGRYSSYLSIEEEKKLLKAVEKEAHKGGILEVKKVHNAFEKRIGGKISLVTTYRLLHRHGWRKIAPRPRHPQANKAVQGTFKKTGKISSARLEDEPKS